MLAALHELFARLRAVGRSLAFKFFLLLAIFLAVPLILYGRLRTIDEQKNTVLARSIQDEGNLIAITMSPLLASFQEGSANALKQKLVELAKGRGNAKLLFRPKNASDPGSFFYIASAPQASADYLGQEMAVLVKTGILDMLRYTCEGDHTLSTRYQNPHGDEEILTSIAPINLPNGCWAVFTSSSNQEFVKSSFAQPYWKTPQVRVALGIYVLIAVVVIALFASVWRSLLRFEQLARQIRTERSREASFAADNRIPELAGVAQEFDLLVNALHTSSSSIRQAAEENAHALKTPIAVIRQSLEPLKKVFGQQEGRTGRSLELIERSVSKLDALVSAARRMDEAAAAIIDTPHRKINFSTLLLEELVASGEWPRARGLSMVQRIEPGVTIWGGKEMLETVVENLLENAISFSPSGGTIGVTLRRNGRLAEFVIEDQGPGVDPRNLNRIFERYFSERPARTADEESHFGIGLWIVRRNVEAMGGTVAAANRETGGLKITIGLRVAA